MEILFNGSILDKMEKILHIRPDPFKIILTRPEWKQFLYELEQNNEISDKDDLLSTNYIRYKGVEIENLY